MKKTKKTNKKNYKKPIIISAIAIVLIGGLAYSGLSDSGLFQGSLYNRSKITQGKKITKLNKQSTYKKYNFKKDFKIVTPTEPIAEEAPATCLEGIYATIEDNKITYPNENTKDSKCNYSVEITNSDVNTSFDCDSFSNRTVDNITCTSEGDNTRDTADNQWLTTYKVDGKLTWSYISEQNTDEIPGSINNNDATKITITKTAK